MKKNLFLMVLCLLTACATTNQTGPGSATSIANSLATATMAHDAYSRSDWEESERLYVKLVEISPDNPLFWYRLGNIYTSMNRINAAIIAYSQSLKSDPTNPNVWFNLGMMQLKQSTYTFNQMQAQDLPESPLNERSKEILEGILKLLNK